MINTVPAQQPPQNPTHRLNRGPSLIKEDHVEPSPAPPPPAITVTALDASVQWYASVFDVHPILDIPHPGGIGRILAGTDRQLMFALHRHDANDGRLFAETTTGLNHGGFAVPSCRDLELWQEHLESNGVVRPDTADKPLTQSPTADEPYASVLVFRDPDNIQLEVFAPVISKE